MKALALLSGGLDSTLATKLILDQGIEVEAINFTSPLCTCNRPGHCEAKEVAGKFKIKLKTMQKGSVYFNKIIRNPKYGYGKNLNPCIDCRIFILKKAKAYAKKINVKFIFTGEVLNERPMSQHKNALFIIEKEAGLKEKLLRPLSAKLLPETEAEKKHWVDRNKLLAIYGRSRKPQIGLAKKLSIENYKCPSGGCLLTDENFSRKMKDFLDNNKNIDTKDVLLLKIGRHFRLGKNKIIVGRNEIENKQLLILKNKNDLVFEVINEMGPITILQGENNKKAIERAASLTAYYSDAKSKKVPVQYKNQKIMVYKISKKEIDRLRI